MNASELRPAKEFAMRYGVKALVYGAPGSGKTPIFNSAPRPLLCCCEPGMLSMRNSTVPTCLANTPERLDDFFKWFFNSTEVKNFDTIGLDSGSEMANIYLKAALKSNKHGQAAYGEMARRTYAHLWDLFFMQQKHVYIICQQGIIDNGGTQMFIPGFPGRALEKEVPHLYDLIMHLGIKNIPNVGMMKAFQCGPSFDILARDRSGMLAQFEPCDLTALFNKAMS